MRALAVIAAAVFAVPSLADEGELNLSSAFAVEAASIRHPLTDVVSADGLAPFSLVTRVALGARYGVTNELQLGFGVDGGGAANVVTDGVTLGGGKARLITGGFFEIAAPLTVGWRVDSGYDVSGALIVEFAPTIALWSATAATDPAQPSRGGLVPRLPIEVGDALSPGARGRLHLAFDARLFGVLGVRVGAYAGIAWAGSASLRVGVLFEPSWIL